ncbi:MAM domain-containing glycosylphosphatidylinositol anchor protein 1-like [Macrosteles quadrilineatus]|uniref:MAM domain-containing glycosylphosphatidylinositol anchor protein 1-like n=1 Tax=Macrosteles quadrilineatus TaxID=74068 RepID=UPI0023E2DAD2|nr:MAM domain-containing glycosylphosphatidylinositol anchor protein 1-like [Macrosteles quadrilineatus]
MTVVQRVSGDRGSSGNGRWCDGNNQWGLQSVGTEPPRFASKGQEYEALEGDTLLLPCSVENLGSHVLLWRKGNLILTAAKLMVARDSRLSLLQDRDYDLRIANITAKDAGQYICQIADISSQDQVHKVSVLAPPRIVSTAANSQLTARKGSSVTLTCSATGNPQPTVLWSKKDSGHLYKPGSTVTLDRVDRHHAGVYQCTATNGVGPPAVLDVRLDVLHPPEIEVEQGWVNTAEGSQVKLVCTVYGNPTPNLLWYHEGALVVATKRYSTDTVNNRHSLSLAPVLRQDFGNFSCVAENPLGRSKHTIQLSGKPGKLRVVSSPYSSSSHSYNFVWRVDSASPLEECRVLYRKIMINDSHQQVGPWLETRFRPPSSSTLSLLLGDLQPSSVYQGQTQVRNRYGWSDMSEPFQFYTRGDTHDLFENNVEHLSSPSASVHRRGFTLSLAIFHLFLQFI